MLIMGHTLEHGTEWHLPPPSEIEDKARNGVIFVIQTLPTTDQNGQLGNGGVGGTTFARDFVTALGIPSFKLVSSGEAMRQVGFNQPWNKHSEKDFSAWRATVTKAKKGQLPELAPGKLIPLLQVDIQVDKQISCMVANQLEKHGFSVVESKLYEPLRRAQKNRQTPQPSNEPFVIVISTDADDREATCRLFQRRVQKGEIEQPKEEELEEALAILAQERIARFQNDKELYEDLYEDLGLKYNKDSLTSLSHVIIHIAAAAATDEKEQAEERLQAVQCFLKELFKMLNLLDSLEDDHSLAAPILRILGQDDCQTD